MAQLFHIAFETKQTDVLLARLRRETGNEQALKERGAEPHRSARAISVAIAIATSREYASRMVIAKQDPDGRPMASQLALSRHEKGKTMRLYYHPLSSNSRRVIMTAICLGIELELKVIDLMGGEHKTASYLKMNPNGKVPLLEDGAFRLWESHAIMQYLADTSLGQDLYPKDPQARADVNRWLFWSAYHFTPAVGLISRERVSKKMVGGTGEPDQTEIRRGEAWLMAAAGVLDAHLIDKQWIAQNQLTLADLAIASPLMHMAAASLPVMGYKHLQAWFSGVQTLDAWKWSEPIR